MPVVAERPAATRDQVLAALSQVFAEAVVDEQRLLDAVAEQVGEATGDAVVIRLVDEVGRFRALAAYHPDPALRRRVRAVTAASRPQPGDGGWGPLLQDRAPLRVVIKPGAYDTSKLNAEQVAFLQSTPITHVVGVPFVARGRVLGAMQVLRCVRLEPHTDAEVALVREVGERAALAVDNARLWAAETAARQRAERAEIALRSELEERLRAEQRLRESEEQLRLLFQNVVDYAMVLLDVEGRVVSWNAGAERMTGWSAAEVGGHRVALMGLLDGNTDVRALLDRVRAEGRAELATTAQRRGGEPYEVHAVLTPVHDAGELRGFAVVMRDVTLLREAGLLREANALLEARTRELGAANEELEAFTYSVSHDLRAPLRAIDGFSEAVLEDHGASLAPDARAYLLRVRAAAQRMQQLIDDLLTLSRSTRGTLAPIVVDVPRVVQDVVAELRGRDPARNVELVVPAQGRVLADPRLLHIVLENLLGNAWKFTRARDPARIEVEVAHEDGGVRITVRDNGAGFEGTQAGRLFQPFQRLHRVDEFEGTGIGLAIVRRILNRHGGRAWAEGEVGKGASVHVWFPCTGHAET